MASRPEENLPEVHGRDLLAGMVAYRSAGIHPVVEGNLVGILRAEMAWRGRLMAEKAWAAFLVAVFSLA